MFALKLFTTGSFSHKQIIKRNWRRLAATPRPRRDDVGGTMPHPATRRDDAAPATRRCRADDASRRRGRDAHPCDGATTY